MHDFYTKNLTTLKQRHNRAYQILLDIHDSFPEYETLQNFLYEPEWTVRSSISQYIILGLGPAQFLQKLLNEIPQTAKLLILEPVPELSYVWFHKQDYLAILNDTRTTYMVAPPAQLLADFTHWLLNQKDVLLIDWLFEPIFEQIAQNKQDIFYSFYVKIANEYKKGQKKTSFERLSNLDALFKKIQPLSKKAYQTHLELSCHKGCSGCCRRGAGLNLFLRPVEWEYMFRFIRKDMQSETRQRLFFRAATYIESHQKHFVNLQYFLNRRMVHLQEGSSFTRMLNIVEEAAHDPCPFLENEACSVYPGRPTICRLFGNGYFPPSQPYTCEIDWDSHLRILDSPQNNHLVEARSIFHQLQTEIHQFYPYGHVFCAWLFTHMDFEQGDFIAEPRLDYQQFDVFIQANEREKRFQALKTYIANH